MRQRVRRWRQKNVKPLLWGIGCVVVIMVFVFGIVFAGVLGGSLDGTRLTQVGTYIYGVATAVLAFGAIIGGGLALFQFYNQRRREMEQRQREQEARDRDARIEQVRHQGELVRLLWEQCDRTKDPGENKLVAQELENAEHVYEEVLRGLLTTELSSSVKAVLTAQLEYAICERERLRRGGDQES